MPFGVDDGKKLMEVLDFVDALLPACVEKELNKVLETFQGRHSNLSDGLIENYEIAIVNAGDTTKRSEPSRLLAGAYLSMEYAIEGAALFNPSIVALPQSTDEELQWLMSMRATGEGHLSSVVFESGKITNKGEFIVNAREAHSSRTPIENKESKGQGNYTLKLPTEKKLSSLLIFPRSKEESRGVEDLRLVRFLDKAGESTYYGTYTAYDGFSITPKLLETKDFRTIVIHNLKGQCAQNKGMALFPRKIDDQFVMCSRNDGRNLYIMYSKDLCHWENMKKLAGPKYPWEGRIIGNCGSPIETDAGWLLLTHAVGPMRRYTLSAMLLDRHDPTKIIGRLCRPLMEPLEEEREGYVPNVLYTCGALVHKDTLYIPYAMSDEATSVATVELAELLTTLQNEGP